MKCRLENIVEQLHSESPVSSVTILKQIASIDWNRISDRECDICIDIILRITADLIVFGFNNLNYDAQYIDVFKIIYTDIKESEICIKYPKFKFYFDSYATYYDIYL